jgi:alpha-galactosidase
MRFTKKGGNIDLDKAESELKAAIDAGVNYLDTAYIYPGSEVALGEILSRTGLRDKVNIATKLPGYMIKSEKSIEKHFQDGYTLKEENWLNANFRCKHRVKMDLFKRYGWIAAAGDRHLVEFMPGNEYLKDPETVQSWDYSLTTVQWRKEDLKERLERSNRLAEGKETIRLEPTGEEGILLIKALCGLQRFISNVNIPNYASQIPNLPKDAIVETNAVFSKDHIRPVYAGPLKDDVLQLIKPHIENHALTYRAAIQCDKALVMQAFQNDPNVKGHHPSSEEIHELVEDMIQNTLTYLPEGWKNY